MKSEDQHELKHPSRSPYRLYWWTFGALFALSLILLLFSPKKKVVPDELLGVWTTTDPAYQDRFLAIYSSTVSFGTGQGTVTTGFVTEIKETSDRGEIDYSLSYTDDNGQQVLSLALETATGTLRLRNQPKIPWKKSSAT